MTSIAIVALYLWATYGSGVVSIRLAALINLPTTILAGLTLVISLITYVKVPTKYIFHISLAIYLLASATAATLIATSGNLSSPFTPIWILVCIFAGIFGLWGFLPVLATSSTFITIGYINGSIRDEAVIITILGSLLPIIAGLLMWRNKSTKDEINSDNRAFRNLANELSEVASKSEVVINAIGDGVIAIDNQGIIQLINPTAQNILGWGKQDALALNYKSVLQLINQKNEALDAASDPIQQALNINQQIRTNSLTLMTKSGKKIMISLVVSPFGEVGSGVIVVFHDVTKEKAEEREQAEFISTASHEMRTPVASIEGYLGLALNPATATIDERARNFILNAHSAAQHLGRLFQDLLDVSKADDGRISNNPKVVNIVTFLQEIVQGLGQKAADKNLRLTYKPMPDGTRERHIAPVYYVNLDNDHIREVVNNLVENAIKYTPTGEVIVDVEGTDDHVVISVKDSGIGIPAEDMPHLFQKFYRVDNNNTRSINGTGLGLYLCRRLIEIMGGRIWVESVYGSGSTFRVELPRIENQQAAILMEQESFRAAQEAKQQGYSQPQPPIQQTMSPVIANPSQALSVAPPRPIEQPVQLVTPPPRAVPTHAVPRSQALTPEQIAAYVTRQRELARQQAGNRPQAAPITNRVQM